MKLNFGCFLPSKSQQLLNVKHEALPVHNFARSPKQDKSSFIDMDTCPSISGKPLEDPSLQLDKSNFQNSDLDSQVSGMEFLNIQEQQCGRKPLSRKLEDERSTRLAEKIKHLGEILKNIDESRQKRANSGLKTMASWALYKRGQLKTNIQVMEQAVFNKTNEHKTRFFSRDNHEGSMEFERLITYKDITLEEANSAYLSAKNAREMSSTNLKFQASADLVNHAPCYHDTKLQAQRIEDNPCSHNGPKKEFRVQLERIADEWNMNDQELFPMGKERFPDRKLNLSDFDGTKELLSRLDNLEQMMKTKERSRGIKKKVKHYAASIGEHLARTDAAVRSVENKLQGLASLNLKSGNAMTGMKCSNSTKSSRGAATHEAGQKNMEDTCDNDKIVNSKLKFQKLQKHTDYQDIQNISYAAEEIHKHWSTVSTEIELCWSAINQLCIDNEQFREELRQQKAFIQKHCYSSFINHQSQKLEKIGFAKESLHEFCSHFVPCLPPRNPMQKVKRMKCLHRSFHLKRGRA